ncbi:MAG: hypothetical protein WD069_16215 [Planctomycetales bacterium]
MRTAFILSVAAPAIAVSASLFGQSPKEAGSLSIQLPQELLDAGWSARSVVRPATPDSEATRPQSPGQGAAQRIVMENRSLSRDVTLKDGSRKPVHAEITLAVYPHDRMGELLPAWEAAYQTRLKAYHALLKDRPETALAPPRSPDSFLFWQTREHALLLFEDEVGFPESARVKSAVKRRLVGR